MQIQQCRAASSIIVVCGDVQHSDRRALDKEHDLGIRAALDASSGTT
jgi:hypothetical protein